MIKFENVSFAYDATPEEKSLRNFSLTIEGGECVLITGPSGCGKSTLLRLLNGLIPEFYGGKTEGSIKIDGNEIRESSVVDQAGKIGTVFQNPRSQFFNVDTTSELAFGPENLALPEDEILRRIAKTVKNFSIGTLMDRSIFELSGGEKQKIACASVDVLAPEIILLDEPSANLDFEAAENLRELILHWKNAGKTILIAEHRINYIWDLADRVVILENGVLAREIKRDRIARFTEEDATRFGLRCLARTAPTSLVKVENEASGQTQMDDTIILKNFHYSYDKKQELYSIPEMKIRKGKVTAIVGANGAGKTTFLESVCGIRKNSGIMVSDGVSYTYKKRIGMIFMVMQDVNHQLFTESVLDEVLISQPEEDENGAKAILAEVGLKDFSERHPMSLSGGQKQRIALACAIASNLPFLLLDEPTSGLDHVQMYAVAEILNRLKNEGRTIITVTHDSEFIEHCCDDVIRMEEA
ncbi:MAG: ABC transporter ATP-binding protein [Ruminococcus sp.]|nr:ABC transporter ATP-binding protein [Ruminococcus sp.]